SRAVWPYVTLRSSAPALSRSREGLAVSPHRVIFIKDNIHEHMCSFKNIWSEASPHHDGQRSSHRMPALARLPTALGLQSRKHLFRCERQVHYPHAHGVAHSVGDGGGHRGVAAFADAFALVRRRAW